MPAAWSHTTLSSGSGGGGFLGGGGSGGGSPAPAPSQPEKTTQITREAPEIEARKLALFDEAIELGTMPIPVPAIQVAPPSPLQQQQFAQAAGLASLGQPAFQQGIGSVQQAQTVSNIFLKQIIFLPFLSKASWLGV